MQINSNLYKAVLSANVLSLEVQPRTFGFNGSVPLIGIQNKSRPDVYFVPNSMFV